MILVKMYTLPITACGYEHALTQGFTVTVHVVVCTCTCKIYTYMYASKRIIISSDTYIVSIQHFQQMCTLCNYMKSYKCCKRYKCTTTKVFLQYKRTTKYSVSTV